MNLELGRSVGSTEVSPIPGPREKVGETKSACFTFLNLVLVGPRGLNHIEEHEHSNRGPAAVAKY